MKKLLFVATASLCATVFGAIESSNVVGYQTKDIDAGFAVITPTFLDVGAANVDIANLKLVDAIGDGGSEQIQILTSGGANIESWVWITTDQGVEADGWYDINSWEPISHKVMPGEGFLINTQGGVKMSVAGQVKAGKTTLTLPAGFTTAGNSTPTGIDIQKIKIVGGLGDGGSEQIQILTPGGVNNETWVWITTDQGVEADGWYDINSWDLIEYTVPAGSAFLFNTQTDCTLEIPAAL